VQVALNNIQIIRHFFFLSENWVILITKAVGDADVTTQICVKIGGEEECKVFALAF